MFVMVAELWQLSPQQQHLWQQTGITQQLQLELEAGDSKTLPFQCLVLQTEMFL